MQKHMKTMQTTKVSIFFFVSGGGTSQILIWGTFFLVYTGVPGWRQKRPRQWCFLEKIIKICFFDFFERQFLCGEFFAELELFEESFLGDNMIIIGRSGP